LTVVVTSPDSAKTDARGLGVWLQRAAPARTRGEVTVALVSDRRMRSLNRAFRGKDYATDVLSFPMAEAAADAPAEAGAFKTTAEDAFLGDIVIASGVARRQAKEAGHPIATEIRVLALHGLLHLLGYDHEHDDGRMKRVEERLRRAAGLEQGLITRGAPARARRRR
jgi:probable rRNA maturation factor